MTSIEKQLESCKGIDRVHRQYLVNINKITKVIGDAQGIKLMVEGIDVPIPVSKTKEDLIRNIHNG